jgi:hypothetical protein
MQDTRTTITNNQPPPPEVNNKTAPIGDPWHVESYSDCKDKDETEDPVEATQTDTYHFAIDPNSIKLQVSDPRQNGNYTANVVNITSTSFQVRIQTKANCFLGISHKSGDVSVSAQYVETYQPPTPPPVVSDTPVSTGIGGLTWGASLVCPVYSDHWILNATLFDGTEKQYASSDSSNPYLQVTYLQGSHQVEISAPSSEQLTKAMS